MTRKLKHDGSAPGNRKHLVLTPYEFLVLLYGLSPPQRPLCVARRLGEKKRKRAGHAASQPGSQALSSTRSLARWGRVGENPGNEVGRALSIFRLLLFLLGYLAGASAEERVIWLSPPGSKIRRILRSDWLHEWASRAILSAWAPQFLQSPVWRLTSGSRANVWRHP